MTLPNFEKISSIFLFIGLGIGLYIIDFNIKSVSKLEAKLYEGPFKILQLKYDRITDSIECKLLKIELDKLNKTNDDLLTTKILNTKILISKKVILNVKRNEEIGLINRNIDEVNNQLEKDSNYPTIIGLFLSFIFIILGIIQLLEESKLKATAIENNSNKSNYSSSQSLKTYLLKKKKLK